MKITIITADKTVYGNGVSYSNLPLTTVPANIHALQFDTVANIGWVEFIDNPDGTKSLPNETITELPSWANEAISDWTNADNAAKTAQAEQATKATQEQPKTTGTVAA
jgi:hypothetical protein